MTTDQKIEVVTKIGAAFPERKPLPTLQKATFVLATLDEGLDDLVRDGANLVGSSVIGDSIIVQYWLNT